MPLSRGNYMCHLKKMAVACAEFIETPERADVLLPLLQSATESGERASQLPIETVTDWHRAIGHQDSTADSVQLHEFLTDLARDLQPLEGDEPVSNVQFLASRLRELYRLQAFKRQNRAVGMIILAYIAAKLKIAVPILRIEDAPTIELGITQLESMCTLIAERFKEVVLLGNIAMVRIADFGSSAKYVSIEDEDSLPLVVEWHGLQRAIDDWNAKVK